MASELRFMVHNTLSDNRHGLMVSAVVTQASGYADKAMINDAKQVVSDDKNQMTLGANKGYDTQEFIEACLEMGMTPSSCGAKYITSERRSAVPETITQSEGYYAMAQQKKRLIERCFGWAKTVGWIGQNGGALTKCVLVMAAHNLTRMFTLRQICLQG